MKTIDFLPDVYRQREALCRARLWWGIVVVIFSVAIGASVMAQAWMRRGLQHELDALAPEYAAAQTQVQELSALQAQIVRASHEASLYTFLENPWPRTQLLAVVVRPLPNSIRLAKINLIDEEMARNVQAGPRNSKAEEEAAAKSSHPEKDLAKLHDELERRQTTIEIEGHTTDVPRLHEYVGDVSRSALVSGATIKSLEAGPANQQQGRTRFTLRLSVRPGYCQRGGETAAIAPVAPPEERRMAGGGGG